MTRGPTFAAMDSRSFSIPLARMGTAAPISGHRPGAAPPVHGQCLKISATPSTATRARRARGSPGTRRHFTSAPLAQAEKDRQTGTSRHGRRSRGTPSKGQVAATRATRLFHTTDAPTGGGLSLHVPRPEHLALIDLGVEQLHRMQSRYALPSPRKVRRDLHQASDV